MHKIILAKIKSRVMKTLKMVLAVLLLTTAVVFAPGCKKTDNPDNGGDNNGDSYGDVFVTTYTPQDITETTVKCGGDVIVTQGLSLTELGVCLSTEVNPTVDDIHRYTTAWNEPFVCTVTGLEPETKYYVRAYALRGLKYYYGQEKSFTTLSAGGGGETPEAPTVPTGAIKGVFTINGNGDKVYFSQGNLQYQASKNIWRFAENQWDYVGTQDPHEGGPSGTVTGSDNANISPTYSGWIDLFGWGTSGYNHGAVSYWPWSTSTTSSEYYAYGSYEYNLCDQTGQADWGYNPISNGGNQENQWRTLTKDELEYVFDTRATAFDIRYVKAQVSNVNGVILFPDDWSNDICSLYNVNDGYADFSRNTFSASQWITLEDAGAVFLPAGGSRYGTSFYEVGNFGEYWSASCYDGAYYGHCAYGIFFQDSGLGQGYVDYLPRGGSVRLVCTAE
jgi:hypothetical protein